MANEISLNELSSFSLEATILNTCGESGYWAMDCTLCIPER